MDDVILYKIFYINHGKYFLTRSYLNDKSPKTAFTREYKNFKEEVGWFTFEECLEVIKRNRRMLEIWGIVDKNGKQYVAGKFDGILKIG